MLVLFFVVFIDLVGFGIVIPLLPFFGEHFQASPDVVTLLLATYSITQLISAPVLGRLSDKYGRRPILLFSLLGSIITYVWLGFAETLMMLFIARAFNGFMAGNIATAFAYIADITTPENRAKGMGVIGAAFGLGFIAGPAIGGILAGPDAANPNFQLPALTAAALSAFAFILAIVKLKESLSEDARAKIANMPPRKHWQSFFETLMRPRLGLLIALSFLCTFVFAGMETTFAMWTRREFGWGPEQNGYLFAFLGIVSALIQGGLIGRLSKKFGEGKLVMVGSLLLGIGIGLIPFSDSVTLLLIATTILAIGFALSTPSLNSLISFEAGETERGGVMGASRSAATLARVLGPILAGILFAQLGRDIPYYAGFVIMLIVAAIALVKLSNQRAPKADKA
ncbi:MFS transporter [Terasakiella pusilla]|jgi:DHA1 family tetracycline resistance protein-like MFS transporter|uniref:MFS transporter n=1 Tax=Terasakiella pusilla TaxID=64973 RepID=UPI00068EF22A|nr:MFS transporter [Terasakiella pusilla]